MDCWPSAGGIPTSTQDDLNSRLTPCQLLFDVNGSDTAMTDLQLCKDKGFGAVQKAGQGYAG